MKKCSSKFSYYQSGCSRLKLLGILFWSYAPHDPQIVYKLFSWGQLLCRVGTDENIILLIKLSMNKNDICLSC